MSQQTIVLALFFSTIPALACAQNAPPPAPVIDAGSIDAGETSDAGQGLPPIVRTSSAATPDDIARFLAGLPGTPGSPLVALEQSPAFIQHAKELDALWQKLGENRLNRMRAWSAQEIEPRIHPKLPLVYIFGGPDAITTDVVYPEAPIYVLAGLEQLGGVPALEKETPEKLARGLSALRTSLRSTVDLSFFITSEMSKELGRTEIRGVLPVMYLFLVRNGARILDMERLYIDPQGNLQPAKNDGSKEGTPKNGVPALHIRFQRADGSTHDLYYFRQDLTNDLIPGRPGMFRFLERLGSVNAFLKAASFILHDKRFSITKKYLLEHSASILQDDSGIPYKALANPTFALTYFGEYTPSRKVFKDHFQEDMKAAFEKAGARPLPFDTGYKHVQGSNLILAVRTSTGAR
ncbi:MAG: hypothetical protein U1E65_20775 [Myxococcota bacterium]